MYTQHTSREGNTSHLRQHVAAQANRLFERVTHRSLLAKMRKLCGKSDPFQLLVLDDFVRPLRVHGRKTVRKHRVNLNEIRGTTEEGRRRDFDVDFRPLQTHNKERWLGVASAWLSGRRPGRVKLVQVEGIYFVDDGHHRISVAKAMGQDEIEADVVTLLVEGTRVRPATAGEERYVDSHPLQTAAA